MRRITEWVRALRPTTAIVAVLATLLVVGAGSAVAAKKYLITSTKQVSPKVLKKLKGKTGKAGKIGKTGPAGPVGAAGAQGPAGPAGAAGANGRDGTDGAAGNDGTDGTNGTNGVTGPRGPSNVIIGFDDAGGTFASAGVVTTISTLTGVPAGKYVYTAKFQVASAPSAGGPYAIECVLRRDGSSNFDAVSVGVRDTSNLYAEPTPATLIVGEDAPITSDVTLKCSRNGGISMTTTVSNVKIEALRVEALAIQAAP